MSQQPTARVIAITKDDGSTTATQLQDVLAFLDRLLNGSLIDERNHNDNSLPELAARIGSAGCAYTKRELNGITIDARALRKRLIGV